MEVRSIVLGPGDSYALHLTGRGARGYVWTWQVTGNTDAVAVTEDSAEPAEPGGALPGDPVRRTYTVRGRPPGGRARIRFAQVRPPYPQEAPYDEFVLEVTVTAGG